MNKIKNKQPCIIQVLPSLDGGGVERGTLETAEAIIKEGWKSIVISSGGKLESRLTLKGSIHKNFSVKSKNLINWPYVKYQLKNFFLIEKPDIIHVRSRVPAWTAGVVARQLNIPLISTVHGRFTANNFIKKYYNSALLKSDKIIAISNYVKNKILELDSSVEEKINVIHRGVDLNTFNPDLISESRMIDLANTLQLPDDSLIIMLAARPSKWKGHEILINAFSKILKKPMFKDKNIFCLMPGADDGGKFYSKIKSLSYRLGVEKNTVLIPYLNDLPAAYMMSDVVVVPSISPEPFGRTAIEAQAMGRPVIAFNHGGTAESIIHEQTGYLARPGDTDDLVKYIEKNLLQDTNNRIKIAKKAREHMVKNFSRDKMTSNTIQIYKKLIENN